jgi:nucleotide-binding universal stress UspA family protein
MKPNVLIPYDFSAAAERALAWAVDLQKSVGGGAIHLIHILDPIPVPVGVGIPSPAISDEDVEEVHRDLQEAAKKVNADTTIQVILSPSAADAILETAKARHTDLIVMGTHGRTGLSRVFLGSVAEHVVRHADCPVLTLRAPAEAT